MWYLLNEMPCVETSDDTGTCLCTQIFKWSIWAEVKQPLLEVIFDNRRHTTNIQSGVHQTRIKDHRRLRIA